MKCIVCDKGNPNISDTVTDGSWICAKCSKKSIFSNGSIKFAISSSDSVTCELLAYVAFYFMNSSVDGIRKVLHEYYHTREVNEAKELLWETCKDNLSNYIARQDSELRSAKDAEISDILNAFKKLDSEGITFPNFVAKHFDRIPKYGPEKLDLASVVDRLSIAESKLAKLDIFDRKIDSLDSKILLNTDKIDRVESKTVQNKDSIGGSFYRKLHN